MPAIDPLSNEFIYQGRGELFAQLDGEDSVIHLGIVNTFKTEPKADTSDVYSSNFPVRTKVDVLTNEISLGVKFDTLSINPDTLALAMMGLSQVNAVAADAGFTAMFHNVKVGGIYDLGRVVTALVIEDGGIIAYVEGTHYAVLAGGRMIQVLAMPAGATTDLHVTGTASAIAGGYKAGIASTGGRYGRLIFVGNEAGKRPVTVEIYRCKIMPEGDVDFIGEKDAIKLTFMGSALPVTGKAPGFHYGQVSIG